MKACIICGCTDDAACDIGDYELCSWFDFAEPLCSRCAGTVDVIVERISLARCTVAQLFEPIPAEACADVARALVLAVKIGAVAFELVGGAAARGARVARRPVMSRRASRVACLLPLERVGDRDQVIAVGLADGLLHCIDITTGRRWAGCLSRGERLRLVELLAHESRLAADGARSST
jgi:hypothetical protein